MSSKPSMSKETIKLNTILTRNKSNSMKRQLRNKDESVRKISQMTQMLLGPTREKTQKSPQKTKKVKSPKVKSERKKSEDWSPKKAKKRAQVKKMLLKPKYDLKCIGSKRKMALPEKAGQESPKRRKRARSPTIQELIRMTEDQDLDDEDLMEILTCDSPVWWEDPPEPSYIEGAISKKNGKEQDSEGQEPNSESPKPTKTEETQTTNITIPENKQSDPRFMNKRTKLENLLGNIKKKSTKTENKETIDKGIVKPQNREDDNKTEDKPKIKHLTDTLTEVKMKKVEIENMKTEIKEEDKQNVEEISEIRSKRSKTSSTSTDEDPFLALRNEDLLNDLQNMNIPIEHDGCSIGDNIAQNTEDIKPDKDNLDLNADEVTLKRNISENESHSTEIIIKEDTENVLTTTESTVDETNDSFNENKRIFLGKARNDNQNTSCGIKPIVGASDSKDMVQIHFIDTITDGKCHTNLEISKSTFNIISIEKTSLPIAYHSINTDTTRTSNVDAISDTNIQFFEDYANIKTSGTTDNEETDSSKTDKNNESGSEVLKSELKPNPKSLIKEHLRAVYKTITSNITEKDELKTNLKDKTLNELDSTSNLDSFYKKCKNGKQKYENNIQICIKAKSETTAKINTNNLSIINKSQCPKCANRTDNDNDNTKNIVPIENSAKYCLKCSSIFETETCTYCTKREKLNNTNCPCDCRSK